MLIKKTGSKKIMTIEEAVSSSIEGSDWGYGGIESDISRVENISSRIFLFLGTLTQMLFDAGHLTEDQIIKLLNDDSFEKNKINY
jgi:hypothetical protein